MIDIHTIEPGAGSIAEDHHGGAFPRWTAQRRRSARPRRLWPRRYRTTATIPTSAPGWLDKNDFLAGSMKLDEAAAHRAIEGLADALA